MLWHYVIPKERNGFSHICLRKKVSKVYIALKECIKFLEPQIWISGVNFSYRQKWAHRYKIIPIYGAQIAFYATTAPILEHTCNMGDNKSLHCMNKILLAVHWDFMHVKIFDQLCSFSF